MATKSIHRRDSALPATANRYAWRAPTVLALAAGLLYCINLGRLPHPDELHHALAARGLLDHGLPSIAEGVYERGLLHTYLVAGSYALFGDSLASARIPSVVCMALVAALLFVWLRREASSLAAWLGAGGFAVSPFAVDIAQFARFYAPQCLAFLVAAFLTYAAVSGRHTLRRRALLLVGALPPALLALNLQPTTLIGLVSIASWAGCVLGIPWLTAPSVPRRHKLAVIAIGVLALMVFLFSGLATTLWQLFRSTPLFNLKNADEFWYYHALYSLFYPTLWPLTGLLGLAAIATWRQPALFALLTFAVSFVLNSLAASKSLRYIIFAQPLLFAVWGMGLAAIWPSLRSFGMDLRQRLGPPLAAIGIRQPAAAGLLVAAAVLFLVVGNPAWLRSASLLADITVPPEQPRPNWPLARPQLEPWLAQADVVVTTEELATLYFLGRYDIRFSPSKMGELEPGQRHEFGLDFRTGRPVISTRESLERVLACYPSGIILGPTASWGSPTLLGPELVQLIESQTRPIELPAKTRLSAVEWQHSAGAVADAQCRDLPRFTHG